MKTIVLTGGGTAGHCLPHFALLDELKKHFDKIYYIGSKTGIEKTLVLQKNIPYLEISTVKLKRSLSAQNALIPFKLIKSVKEAKRILKKIRPNVVFSKGGFVGLPVTIASKQLKIPVIIHESDLSIGLANKIASRFSVATLTSFEQTATKIKNGRHVGCPIREELFVKNRRESLKVFNFSGNKPVLLVIGGSLGAKSINVLIENCLDDLLKQFDVLHVVGKGNLNGVLKKGYFQTEFTEMANAYAVCDIALSRAGANTLFELLALKIPTLCIPLPKTQSRGDQIENAEYFMKKGYIKSISQAGLTANILCREIYKLYNEKEKILSKLNAVDFKNSNKKIIEILTKY